jgi:UrcA family protein
MNKSFLALAAISAVSLSAAGAARPASLHVRDIGHAIEVGVDISGLDPSQPQDARILLDRIRAASAIACREAVETSPVAYGPADSLRDCERNAAEQAIATLNAPQLSAQSQGRGGDGR